MPMPGTRWYGSVKGRPPDPKFRALKKAGLVIRPVILLLIAPQVSPTSISFVTDGESSIVTCATRLRPGALLAVEELPGRPLPANRPPGSVVGTLSCI